MLTKKNILNYTIHIINGLLPIILIVYINSKSSLTFLGYFFKALAIIGSVQLFVDYGFNFSAIRSYRELLAHKLTTQVKVNYFFNVTMAKLLIGAIIILIYSTYIILIQNKFIIADFSFIFFGIIFSLSNFNWYFYAIDSSLNFSLILLCLRILSIVVLVYVKVSLDLLLIINFAPFLISNLLWLSILMYQKWPKQGISKPTLDIATTLKSGWGIFINGIVISFLSMSWPILFSRLVSIEMIGVYGLADRISKGLRNLIGPLPFLILSKKSINTKLFSFTNLNYKYLKFFGLIIISIPLLFMLLPNSMLGFFLKGDIINFRVLLNLYSLGFIAGALNSLFYTYLITVSSESVYLIYFVVSYSLGAAIGLLIGTYIFIPLFIEFILCLLLTFKFIKKNQKS